MINPKPWINITESLTISETPNPKDVAEYPAGVAVLTEKSVTLTVKGTLNNFGVILSTANLRPMAVHIEINRL